LGASSEEFLSESWLNFAAARQSIFTGEAFVWSAAAGAVEAPEQEARASVQPRAPSWVAAMLMRLWLVRRRLVLPHGSL
jgi:hypothetical protein